MDDEPEEELSPETIRELKRRLAIHDSPIRYAVLSGFPGSEIMRLWHNVSSNTWFTSPELATLYKDYGHARAIAEWIGNKSSYRNGGKLLYVVKLTTKNDSIRVLKYDHKP